MELLPQPCLPFVSSVFHVLLLFEPIPGSSTSRKCENSFIQSKYVDIVKVLCLLSVFDCIDSIE